MGTTDWLIFQQSVQGKEMGGSFYNWMETGPVGTKTEKDNENESLILTFNGREEGATSLDYPLPSKDYHPKGYLHSLLIRCLQRDYKLRPTIDEVISHPYFDKFREEFQSGRLEKALASDFVEFMTEQELVLNTVRLDFLRQLKLAKDEKRSKEAFDGEKIDMWLTEKLQEFEVEKICGVDKTEHFVRLMHHIGGLEKFEHKFKL